jgi:hypothetical protein
MAPASLGSGKDMTPSLDNAVQRLDHLEEMLHTLIRTVGTLGGKVSDIEKPSRRRFGAARARDYPAWRHVKQLER